MKMRWIDAKGMDMALIIRLSWMGLIFYDYQSFQPTITPVYKYAIQCTAISYIASKNAFILEIVINELRKLRMSADFFANSSHIIFRCPGV